MMTPSSHGLTWRKSSYSDASGEGNCVEIALADTMIAVRDSKNIDGPVLDFALGGWHTFLTAAKTGRLDLR